MREVSKLVIGFENLGAYEVDERDVINFSIIELQSNCMIAEGFEHVTNRCSGIHIKLSNKYTPKNLNRLRIGYDEFCKRLDSGDRVERIEIIYSDGSLKNIWLGYRRMPKENIIISMDTDYIDVEMRCIW